MSSEIYLQQIAAHLQRIELALQKIARELAKK